MNLYLLITFAVTFFGCDSKDDSTQDSENIQLTCIPTEITVGPDETVTQLQVSATREWSVYSNENWISCTPPSSIKPEETVQVTLKENTSFETRTGSVIFRSGVKREVIPVTQSGTAFNNQHSAYVPEGYSLIWNDEFETGTRPNTQVWSYETGDHGWGNNELQNYIAGSVNGEDLASVSNGIFKIIAKKIDNTVYSIRINSKDSWKYGYFEARLKLPSGKGTWPAFWMMPKNFTSWPEDGEIDIMEEVGYRPNWVSSAVHTKAYNHKENTQKTGETFLESAQSEFHIYALKWTANSIETYVDGKRIFTFNNDGKENKDTWPFDQPFYLKLNLAWGGDWGGSQGIDETALPAVYEIDYVRVYQTNK